MALNQGRWIANFIMACSLFGLVSCGGGGGGTTSSGTPTAQQSTATVSNGTVTALGSVFVNGHEFDTTSASFVDADTGILNVSQNTSLYDSGLLSPTVGMLVAVNSATNSTNAVPVAKEIRINPLVRGYVDASDLTNGTITVMGQTIQVTSSTAFTDKRSCVSASSPCTPITGLSNLLSTSVSNSTTTYGTYVIVYGYSYVSTSTAQAQIVATMVSAWDENNSIFTTSFTTDQGTSTQLYPFKVSGSMSINTTTNPNTIMIGNESINFGTTVCTVNGVQQTTCTNLINSNYIGSYISARGATAPSSNIFTPSTIAILTGVGELNPGGSALQVGQTVEIEGTVSNITGTTFIVRGISVDGSQLTGSLPTVGSKVELTGTVSANGNIVATSIQSEIASSVTRTIFAAPVTVSTIAPGATASTNCPVTLPAYTLTILGQPVVVDCNSEIADRTATSFAAFNINNFTSYLNGLLSNTSQTTIYAVVSTYTDSSSVRRASSINVISAPQSGFVSVSGLATTGTASTGTSPIVVQGVTVDFGSTSTVSVNNQSSTNSSLSVAVGDYVTAMGVIGANSNEINTNVSNGVLATVSQANLQSAARTNLGEGDGHSGETQGFRGFEH